MGINQLYNDNLRKLPNKYGDVSVMVIQNITACEMQLLYITGEGGGGGAGAVFR